MDRILPALLETLSMALLGTGTGFLAALPRGYLTSVAHGSPWIRKLAVPWIRVAHGLPPLVWGAIFIVLIGFGPLAGSSALALLFAGTFVALLREELDAVQRGPPNAWRRAGEGESEIFRGRRSLGCWARFLRRSSGASLAEVMGLAGAGVGKCLYQQISAFEYPRVAATIPAVFLAIGAVRATSAWASSRLSG